MGRDEGSSIHFFQKVIPHHFQAHRNQLVRRLNLEQVGLSWVIFGQDGYILVMPFSSFIHSPHQLQITPGFP
jgi:hypothetical protein